MDILIVLGSVTSKQYEPARLKMLRKGQKPRIVRLATHPATVTEIASYLRQEDEDHWDTLGFGETMREIEQYQKRVINGAFGDMSLDNVRAILTEPAPEGYDENLIEEHWIFDRFLDRRLDEYKLNLGEDGSTWLS